MMVRLNTYKHVFELIVCYKFSGGGLLFHITKRAMVKKDNIFHWASGKKKAIFH